MFFRASTSTSQQSNSNPNPCIVLRQRIVQGSGFKCTVLRLTITLTQLSQSELNLDLNKWKVATKINYSHKEGKCALSSG